MGSKDPAEWADRRDFPSFDNGTSRKTIDYNIPKGDSPFKHIPRKE